MIKESCEVPEAEMSTTDWFISLYTTNRKSYLSHESGRGVSSHTSGGPTADRRWGIALSTGWNGLAMQEARGQRSSDPCTVEPQFNKLPRDWANWFDISRVHYIENLVIMNLLTNKKSVRYVGVWLIINRSNKRQRR